MTSGSLGFLSFVLLAASAVSAGAQPQPPTPGPEHEILKMDAGTWDAAVEVSVPGMGTMTSKGTEVNALGCGGLCLITDFTGDLMPGMSFAGHGVATWDPRKKKYVVSWTDSMSTGLAVGESTWDPAAKRMTGWLEGPDIAGQVTKSRSVVEYTDTTRVLTIDVPGPDGKEAQLMKITYTRRK